MRQRRQFSIRSLLIGMTFAAFLLSFCFSGGSLLALLTNLGTLFVLTLLIAIRQRRGLTIAGLCAGPILGGGLGGLIAAFDPMYILPEDRLLVFLGVTVVGLVSGITVAWGSLLVDWIRDQQQ